MDKKASVLVVEDNQSIRDLMVLHLVRDGYHVEEADNGLTALKMIRTKPYDIYLLDWMIPGFDGIQVAKEIRAQDKLSGIIMVTAKSAPEDIILGLSHGADDYVIKPFEPKVLLARVKSVLRRSELLKTSTEDTSLIKIGNISINTSSYEVKMGSELLDLTRSEFRLLTALARNQGAVMARQKLIDEIQGDDVVVTDRTVDTHVFGLRKKLGELAEVVETVRGVGYRVRAPEV